MSGYDEAKAAIAAMHSLIENSDCSTAADSHHLGNLVDLVELFAPYEGDDPDEARERSKATAAMVHCPNCGYEEPFMYMGGELGRTARAAIRRAICPRCFSTQMKMGRKR